MRRAKCDLTVISRTHLLCDVRARDGEQSDLSERPAGCTTVLGGRDTLYIAMLPSGFVLVPSTASISTISLLLGVDQMLV